MFPVFERRWAGAALAGPIPRLIVALARKVGISRPNPLAFCDTKLKARIGDTTANVSAGGRKGSARRRWHAMSCPLPDEVEAGESTLNTKTKAHYCGDKPVNSRLPPLIVVSLQPSYSAQVLRASLAVVQLIQKIRRHLIYNLSFIWLQGLSPVRLTHARSVRWAGHVCGSAAFCLLGVPTAWWLLRALVAS